MFHKVLVVDDRWDDPDRRMGYTAFERLSRSSKSAFNLELEYLQHPTELAGRLAQTQYSALLIDVKLDNWPGCKLSEIMSIVGNSVPIALVSKYWNDTTSDDVNVAWAKPNCKTFIHWEEIAGEDERAGRAMLQLSKIIAEYRGLDISLSLGPDEPISLLHISDLQIGGFDIANAELEMSRIAEKVMQESGTPTFIAFTGDVTERGMPSQFEDAKTWLHKFIKKLNFPELPTERFLLIPGNHDVCLPLAASHRIGLKSGSSELELKKEVIESNRELALFAFSPFCDFAASVSALAPTSVFPTRRAFSGSWYEGRFRHLGVSFYGLNTCSPIGPGGWPGRTVSSDELAFVGDGVRRALKEQGDKNVVIGLGHHSPMASVEDKSVSNPEAFRTFFCGEVKTSIFLHGHIHERTVEYHSPGGFRLVRCCASTLTKAEKHRAPDTLRGFSLLQMSRRNHKIESLTVKSFDWLSGNLIGNERKFSLGSDGMFADVQ